jgi:NhaP-type Na+/H+ or K+/H+ antiporter
MRAWRLQWPFVESFALWAALIGAVLLVTASVNTVIERLPLSLSMFYLLVGAALSPWWLDLVQWTAIDDAALLERLTEIVVVISLFVAGLKLSAGMADRQWLLPVRLATTSMVVTVAVVALLAWGFLGLEPGPAILLGAILAPTDPVLASEVQVSDSEDRDRLRFALTGEGGLNDGTAFPFVMLGLGLMGLHEIGESGWRWVAVDLAWATACGVGVGAALGSGLGHWILYLRRRHHQAIGLDSFIGLGLTALAYGVTVLLSGYGFLAAFAAGVALRRVEQRESAAAKAPAAPSDGADGAGTEASEGGLAVHPQHGPAYMAHEVLDFKEQVERIGEVVAVIAIGALLWSLRWDLVAWWLVLLLMLVVRPVAVVVGLAGSGIAPKQRRLIGWFGLRGVGSIYYLMYAIGHGLPERVAEHLTAITVATVVTSVVLHGISVTPLMQWYRRDDGGPPGD